MFQCMHWQRPMHHHARGHNCNFIARHTSSSIQLRVGLIASASQLINTAVALQGAPGQKEAVTEGKHSKHHPMLFIRTPAAVRAFPPQPSWLQAPLPTGCSVGALQYIWHQLPGSMTWVSFWQPWTCLRLIGHCTDVTARRVSPASAMGGWWHW